MNQTHAFRTRSAPLFLALATLLGPNRNAYSQDSAEQPHPLVIRKATLTVRGVYWHLPLAGIDSLELRSDTIIVKGPCSESPLDSSRCAITRTVPSDLIAGNLVQVFNLPWHEADYSSSTVGDSVWERPIFNIKTNDRFSFGDPFNSHYQLAHEYQGLADTVVFVYAFGKKGQDAQKWMTYILVTK